MASLFAKLGFTNGVEVGTRQGAYAKSLCQRNPDLHLTCVDPWMAYGGSSQDTQDRRYAEAIEALRGLPIEYIRLPSLTAVRNFDDGCLDFVFIDGNHLFDFIMRDIIEWVPKVRDGGIVAIHDYHNNVGADVIMAVNAYTHCHGINPWYVTRDSLPTAFWVKT